MRERLELVAHRGFSTYFAENSKSSIRAALEYNPYGVEVDVVVMNGRLYAYHPKGHSQIYGERVDGVITRELTEMNLSTLSALELGRVVADLQATNVRLLLDLKQKSSKQMPNIIRGIKRLGFNAHRLIVGARDMEKLGLLMAHSDLYQIMSLSMNADSYSEYIDAGASIVRLWIDDVTDERVRAIHTLGAEVWVTPGHPTTPEAPGTAGEITSAQLIDLAKLSVDAVLVNDLPQACEILDEYYQR